jgi:hypothetical protein
VTVSYKKSRNDTLYQFLSDANLEIIRHCNIYFLKTKKSNWNPKFQHNGQCGPEWFLFNLGK